LGVSGIQPTLLIMSGWGGCDSRVRTAVWLVGCLIPGFNPWRAIKRYHHVCFQTNLVANVNENEYGVEEDWDTAVCGTDNITQKTIMLGCSYLNKQLNYRMYSVFHTLTLHVWPLIL